MTKLEYLAEIGQDFCNFKEDVEYHQHERNSKPLIEQLNYEYVIRAYKSLCKIVRFFEKEMPDECFDILSGNVQIFYNNIVWVNPRTLSDQGMKTWFVVKGMCMLEKTFDKYITKS